MRHLTKLPKPGGGDLFLDLSEATAIFELQTRGRCVVRVGSDRFACSFEVALDAQTVMSLRDAAELTRAPEDKAVTP